MIWILLALIEITVLLVYGRKAWSRRWWNILIGLDQLLNAWAGGDPDETLSSRAAKRLHQRGWNFLGRILEKIDHGHMKKALEPDEGARAAWHGSSK